MDLNNPFVFRVRWKIGEPVAGVQDYGRAEFTYPNKTPVGDAPALYRDVWSELIDEGTMELLDHLDILGLIDARVHEHIGD